MSVSSDNLSGITNVRKIVLSFLQQLFYYDPVYTWRSDLNSTKIDIVNEYATRRTEIEKYPKVVLSRGNLSLRNVTMGKQGVDNSFFAPDVKHFQDLANGSLVLNVLSKQGIEAEQVAEQIFMAIIAWRAELRETRYLFNITDISVGAMQPVITDSDVRVMQVPVYITYNKQINFYKAYDYYDTTLTVDDARYYQNTDYYIYDNLVTFVEAPDTGADIQMAYSRRDTMASVSEAPSEAADGSRTIFTFTYPIYGPYYVTSGVDLVIEGTSWLVSGVGFPDVYLDPPVSGLDTLLVTQV